MDPFGVSWAATRALLQNNLPSLAIGIIEILMNMILDKHQSAFGERTPKQQIRDSINIQQAVGAYFGIYSWYQINICFQTKSSPQSNFRHKCMQECRMWLDWNATHFFLPPSQLLLVAVLPLNRTDLYQLLMPSSASRYQSQNVTVFITLKSTKQCL